MQERRTEILHAEHLKKYFMTPKGTLHAVNDANFSTRTGETLGVVGESGCGKSIISRAILRLHEPTNGKVYLEDRDIPGCGKRQLKDLRRDMRTIFQDPFASLSPRMTAGGTIIEPLLVQGIYKASRRAVITQRVEKIMNLVGLAKRLIDIYPHELDGGRRQRIGIARALAVNPRLIVYDEPVSALDVFIQVRILNLMQDLQEEPNLAYMLTTHDLSVVRYFSNDTVVMYLGQMVEPAPVRILFKNPVHPYTKALLSVMPISGPDFRMERVPLRGEFTSPINPEPRCGFVKRCSCATEGCTNNEMTLKGMEPGHFVGYRMVQEQG